MAQRPPSGRLKVAALVLLLLIAGGVFAFRGAGRWLVREDSLAHADAIFVLSGGMPFRAEEAANVFRQGYAPEVWLSHPQNPASQLAAMGISYVTEEEYIREILIHSGVPAPAIHVLPDEIANTEQELEAARREMNREGKSSLLIVTSPEHTRRVRTLWRVLFGSSPKLIVHAAPQDPFDADHWWRHTADSLALVREYLGLLNAWAGLPVRPRSS